MKEQTKKPLKSIASLVLITTLSQNVSANDINAESNNDGTYWGVGIGSVLGAVIAGPPGAAIGATLGGTYGWGQDKDNALNASLAHLNQTTKQLESSEMALRRNRSALHNERQKVGELSRSNAEINKQISSLMAKQSQVFTGGNDALLENITSHYQQEVFFKKGERSLPDYAEERITQLSDFLKQHPSLDISLKGFADHRGPAEFNEQLALSRAESIRNFLVTQGVAAERIDVRSMGESNTLAQPGDAGNYILDRRVAIELSLRSEIAGQDQSTDHLEPKASEVANNNPELKSKTDLIETVLAEASK